MTLKTLWRTHIWTKHAPSWWPSWASIAAWELRRRRRRRRRQGLCTDCGVSPAATGKVKCTKCQAAANASDKRTYHARKEAGQCPRCGCERDSEYLECETCRDRQRQQRERRQGRGYVRPSRRKDKDMAPALLPYVASFGWPRQGVLVRE